MPVGMTAGVLPSAFVIIKGVVTTARVKFALELWLAASRAVMLAVNVPGCVGVPVISPLLEFTVKPGGMPVADQE